MFRASRFSTPWQALCIIGVLAGFMGSSTQSANGAIVLFAPEEIHFDRNGQEPGEMTVAIALIGSAGGSLTSNSFDLLFGSHTVPMTELVFPSSFLQYWNVAVLGPPSAGLGKYENEVLVQAVRNSIPEPIPHVTVATLGIDLTGLEAGSHEIVVDPEWSFVNPGSGTPETISGTLPISIVPEPSVAVLLIIGVSALALRSRLL